MTDTVEVPIELLKRIDDALWSAKWAAGKVEVECKRFRCFPREIEALGEKRSELNDLHYQVRKLTGA